VEHYETFLILIVVGLKNLGILSYIMKHATTYYLNLAILDFFSLQFDDFGHFFQKYPM